MRALIGAALLVLAFALFGVGAWVGLADAAVRQQMAAMGLLAAGCVCGGGGLRLIRPVRWR